MKNKYFALLSIILFLPLAYAETQYEANKDKVNIRVDSTVFSESLGYASKGQVLEVVEERFDWYKIILPADFFSYIAKDYTRKIDSKTIRTTASKINIRNKPSLNAPTLGQVPKSVELKLITENDEWLKVEAYPYAYGWIHKKFVDKTNKEINLSTFVDERIRKLSDTELNNEVKETIYQELSKKGKIIIPLIEANLTTASYDKAQIIKSVLIYSAGHDSDFALFLLKKIEMSTPPEISGIYIDVLKNITGDNFGPVSYYNLAKEGILSPEDIAKAKETLQQNLQ